MADERPDVEGAYALKGAEAVKRLYRDWAGTYDADFIAARGYVYPEAVAAIFAEEAGPDCAPVLDLGCGSGAVAQAMASYGAWAIDGLDLSPEMLEAARAKALYRGLVEGDILKRLPIADGAYRAAVSAGTFTHGHVGPDGLHEALRVCAPGALFCLGVNAEHFEAQGFKAAFDALFQLGAITDPRYQRRRVYTAEATHERAGDAALVAVFRKT